MPGRTSPIVRIAERLGHRTPAHSTPRSALADITFPSDQRFLDIKLQFIGASGLPRTDVVGSSDPYFVANIDNQISMVSTIRANTLNPVWNEPWFIRNVPDTAVLHVNIMDKDNGPYDDYVGQINTPLHPGGTMELQIKGSLFQRSRGVFWLKIDTQPATYPRPSLLPYMFDGPVRFSRHCSPTVGTFTNLNQQRLYTTWKVYLRGVRMFFGDVHQHWNTNYQSAQSIFSGPTSFAVRAGIQAGHRLLYARSTNNGFGTIESPSDLRDLFQSAGTSRQPLNENQDIPTEPPPRIKPAIYTYIVSSEDDSLRFSETGAAFFVDFASKHALHSNCAETVRYSGEFHPRPAKGGWSAFHDDIPDSEIDWELVVDNNSGTYAPDKEMLPLLKDLLEYNFPGFKIHAWDREDPRLKKSVEDCRQYAILYRAVKPEELEPTVWSPDEVSLSHLASVHGGRI